MSPESTIRIEQDLTGKKVQLGLMADPPYRDQNGELTGITITNEVGDVWYEVYLPQLHRNQKFTAQMLKSRDGIYPVKCMYKDCRKVTRLSTVKDSTGLCAVCKEKHFPGEEAT
jgi:hypothetical protein